MSSKPCYALLVLPDLRNSNCYHWWYLVIPLRHGSAAHPGGARGQDTGAGDGGGAAGR